jgi:hypothetical protein
MQNQQISKQISTATMEGITKRANHIKDRGTRLKGFNCNGNEKQAGNDQRLSGMGEGFI